MKWVGRAARLVVAVGILLCAIAIALTVFGQIITVPPLLLGALWLFVAGVFTVTLLALILLGGLRSRNIVRSAASVLARRELVAAAVLAAGFWVAAGFGFAGASGGQPVSTPECPTALDDHGTITCVSQEVFHQAVAAQQLIIAGAFGWFLVFELLGNIIVSRLASPRPRSEPTQAQAHSR
ncbi:MAG: hypothetical protein CVT65_16285 [Actinobacteria bacterium HGW-Actinobacteria-5]|nr:MAG: hypothetical protein CVT65_16285 [Actinobacteria bacterium HGW-Actinobacteria-5]